jgi:hypothetical protein
MAKAELKTKPNELSVEGFLNSIEDEKRRSDAYELLDLFKRITGEEPKMWGPSIVGFGSRVLKYESGRELDWMITGFSPRKTSLTLYIMNGFAKYDDHLKRLGKHKTGVSCLYLKRLSDADPAVLEDLIRDSVEYVRSKPESLA